MTIEELRRVLPDWKWEAKRNGFGWVYSGRKECRHAECYGETVWYVREERVKLFEGPDSVARFVDFLNQVASQ